MHAVDLITPPVLAALLTGLIAFVIIYRLIFKKK